MCNCLLGLLPCLTESRKKKLLQFIRSPIKCNQHECGQQCMWSLDSLPNIATSQERKNTSRITFDLLFFTIKAFFLPSAMSPLLPLLKGHGNETDFLGFLQKLIPHESLTLPFEPFRFWLQIRRDIHIRKTIPRYHRYGVSRTSLLGIDFLFKVLKSSFSQSNRWT